MLLVAVSGCGKKGPPLPPLVRVPEAVRTLEARRVADDVLLVLTLPAQNVDQSTPVDLARVDVYGYTGRTAPMPARFAEVAQLVGRIEPGADGAATATLRDTLTPDELVVGLPPADDRSAPGSKSSGGPTGDARAPLKRFYMAVTFSDRGRAGPPSPVFELPLTPLPDAPLGVRTSYDVEAVTLQWDPSGGLVGFLLDRAPLPGPSPLDDGPPAAGAGTLPPGPTRYNVYRQASADAAAAEAGQDTAPPAPTLLNPMPVEGFAFVDPLQGDTSRRCYTVTAVRGNGNRAVEGHSSAPACVTPVDIFPPARPRGLSPIAVEGAISLVWEANTDRDLRGYLVLRGEEGSEALAPITDEVVMGTQFTDRNVTPGVRYVYAVKAVDTQLPEPNVSAESERVDVTAR